MSTLWIFLAAGLGSVIRYAVGVLMTRPSRGFPWGTVAINLTGALAAGAVAGLGVPAMSPISVGFLAGYTTFGTASKESVELIVHRRYGAAAGYVLLTLVGSVTLAAAGALLSASVR